MMPLRWLFILPLALALVLAAPLAGRPVKLGGAMLEIPIPPDFAELTPDMNPTYQSQSRFVDEGNQQLIVLLPEQEIERIKQGQPPDLSRRLDLQISRKLIDQTLTGADFDQLKVKVKSNLERLSKQARQSIDEQADRIGKQIASKSGQDVSFKINAPVPQPPHQETDRLLGYTAAVTGQITANTGQPTVFNATVNTTLAHVRGRLVYLYAHGNAEDQEWTRQISRKWAEALVAANPSDAETARKETGGDDRSRIINTALFAVIIVAMAAVLNRMRNRTREQKRG